mgnify:CR=1 FL=1
MIKRSQDELIGIVTGLQQAKASKEVQLWFKHLADFKDAIASGAFTSKTSEEAFKNIGIIRGIDIAMQLDEMIGAGLTSKIQRI